MDHYAAGALNPKDHGRLVADMDKFAFMVGVHPRWISTPLDPQLLGDEERGYLTSLREIMLNAKKGGICYLGVTLGHDIADRMCAIAGMLTRNIVDVKVMTLSMVLGHVAERDMPKPECLMIPNFFIGKAHGGGLPTWQIAALYDLLMQRKQFGLQTFLYVANMKQLLHEYGASFGPLLASYLTCEI